MEKLKRRNEKALEYVIREYGGYVKAAVNRNLAGLPEEMEECMDDVDFRMRGGNLYYGDQKLEETSPLILGEESDRKRTTSNQGVNSHKKIERPRIESAVFRVLMIES